MPVGRWIRGEPGEQRPNRRGEFGKTNYNGQQQALHEPLSNIEVSQPTSRIQCQQPVWVPTCRHTCLGSQGASPRSTPRTYEL